MGAEAVKRVEASGLEKMREPFPDHHISQLPKGTQAQNKCPANEKRNCSTCGGWHHPMVKHLSYVGHAAITDRLLDCDPGWSWEPLAFDPMGLPLFDSSGGLWIKLTVCGVTRLGYGHAESKDHMDPGAREKEVIGDALRNACMRFGAALELWHKGDLRLAPSEVVAEGQFEEPAPEVKEPKQLPAPKAAKAPAKAQASAEPKPVVAVQPTLPSVQASEPTIASSNGSAIETKTTQNGKTSDPVPSPETIVEGIPPEKLNLALTNVMKQFNPPWKFINIRKFYADHFDASVDIPKGDDMEPAMKRQILAKIIEVEKVAPF